jgi:hypothetical protein
MFGVVSFYSGTALICCTEIVFVFGTLLGMVLLIVVRPNGLGDLPGFC